MEIKDFTYSTDDLRICRQHGNTAVLLTYGIESAVWEVLLCQRCVAEVVGQLLKKRIPLSS